MEKQTPRENEPETVPGHATSNLMVVGIGASAGGIQAMQEFFKYVPADSGMAYVVILHLSPDHDSKLAQVLQQTAVIPVQQVTEKTLLEPDHVYVIPPNQHLVMQDGYVAVFPNMSVEDRRAPVDIFFRTLAHSKTTAAVCVILSGTGANGSMGLKHVKELGGAAFVQNPREAAFNEMPRNSIATDLVDEILNVAQIPQKIISYRNRLGVIQIPVEAEERAEDQQQALREIFLQLRLRTGHDFTNYKRPTLLRRIERRINIRSLPTLPDYVAFLKESQDEITALLKDLLISVTNFFRDKKAFELVEQQLLPRILKGKTSANQVRIWIAGCATGEEAYSLAILIAEKMLGVIDAPKVQIFATDIDDDAIAVAREGLYTINDAADVSPERLHRYFIKEGEAFRIRREIREMILFANHNILKDPPFSHLDLVSCRNVMIYLNQIAQERVIETFHFALEPGSFLFLGTSESVDSANDLFAVVNRENHVFQSRQVSARSYPVPEFVPNLRATQLGSTSMQQQEKKTLERITFGDLHERMLEEYAPPSLVVNEEYEIVHLSEHVGKYLQMSGGEPSQNLLKLVREDLRLELRSALYQAVHRQSRVEVRGLRVDNNDQYELINIHVRPVLRTDDTARGFILVMFEPTAHEAETQEVLRTSDEAISRHLEEELLRIKSQLRNSIEHHEFQAEELKASNEELQAMNEELRSAAEELETSKEELQSINEELRTVNQELKIKIEETTITSNNFQNLINSTDIATIFLDRAFRVVLFTPATRNIFNLIPTDYGRPLSDITSRLEYTDVQKDAEDVLQKLQPVEKEVQTGERLTFLMRILPYRTSDDRINGVVITFIDISKRKAADMALRVSEERFRAFVTASSDAIYRMNADWTEMYNLKGGDFLDNTDDPSRSWLQKYIPESEQSRVNEAIKNAIAGKRMMELEHQVYMTGGVIGWTHSRAIPTLDENGKIIEWFGAASNITQRVEAGKRIRDAEDKYRLQLEQKVEERTAELHKSRNLLKATMDSSSDMVEVFKAVRNDADEVIDFTWLLNNHSSEEKLGEATGKSVLHHNRGGMAAGIFDTFKKVVESGVTDQREVKYTGGQLKGWFYQSVVKLDDGVVATITDITERKKSELEILRLKDEVAQKAEVKYSDLFNSMDEGYCIIKMQYDQNGLPNDWLFLDTNPAFTKHYGIADATGKTIRGLVPGIEEKWMKIFGQVAETGKSIRFEEGSEALGRIFDLYAFRVAEPEENKVGILFTNITQRKQMEAALRENEERFHTLADAVPQVMWSNDEAGVANYFNQRWFDYSGLTFEASAGLGWEAIVHPDDEEDASRKWQVALTAEENFDTEYRLRRFDGAYRWHIGRNVPLKDKSGKLIGWFGSATDIDYVKQTEEALRESEQQLLLLVKQKDEFIAIASHELKTPVTTIKAYAELMQENLESMGFTRESALLKSLNGQINRLTKLINDLLNTSKISEGQLKLALEEIQLNDLLGERIEEIQSTTMHNIQFMAGDLQPVMADRERISQVVVNLLSNAIKYSPKGTTITVTSKIVDKTVEVGVKDEGYGIPEEDQAKIFDRFFRVTANKMDTYPGMGLGLYISSQIIKRHGGVLSVKSEVGKGSLFVFSIPI